MNSLMRGVIGSDETAHKSVQVDSTGRLLSTGLFTEIKPTITVNTVVYVAGDCVGGKLTLANAVGVSGGLAELKSVSLVDVSNQRPVLEILFFNADPSASTLTDHAAFDLAAADVAKVIARVPIASGDWVTLDAQGFASVSPSRVLKAATGTTLYATMICTGTPDFVAATDLHIRFGFEQH